MRREKTTARAILGRPAASESRGLPRAQSRGFTLVEILVVILILGILVSLVVGVGRYVMQDADRRKTSSIQSILIHAVNVYREQKGAYPTQLADADITANPRPTDPSFYGSRFAGSTADAMWAAALRMTNLLDQLAADPKAVAILQKLPPEAIYCPTQPFLGTTGQHKVARDAYDMPMDYRAAGAGGAPVIISGGPDRSMGPGYDGDNIRSDGKGT